MTSVNMTKAELEAENERLRKEVAELRSAGVRPRREVPARPSFGMSEGERDEIERIGSAVSPFDGKRNTAADLPERVTVDENARQGDETTGPVIDYSRPPTEQSDGR